MQGGQSLIVLSGDSEFASHMTLVQDPNPANQAAYQPHVHKQGKEMNNVPIDLPILRSYTGLVILYLAALIFFFVVVVAEAVALVQARWDGIGDETR